MDSSFFLAICASMCSLSYLGSLFIAIQFRGDFGVVSDEVVTDGDDTPRTPIVRNAITATFSYSNLQRRQLSSTSLSSRDKSSLNQHKNSKNTLDANQSIMSGGVFEIPKGDMALLFAPPVAGYGPKLYNVKVGMKDF